MTNAESPDYSNDILQPMQDADFILYRDIAAKTLPTNLYVHHFLTIQHRWKKIFAQPENKTLTENISPQCKKNFVKPRDGRVENCTFVAVSDEIVPAESRYHIYVFTIEWPPVELISSLRETARIDWEARPTIESLAEELAPAVEKLHAEMQISHEWSHPIDCVWLPYEEAIAININIPEEVFFDELSEHHAALIDETWAYRSNTSCNYIRSLIQLNGGLGLFEKSTNQILAWILTNDFLALGCLETTPAARRKGFAKLLTQWYCKKFAENEKLDVYTNIAEDNLASQQLFQRIGFRLFQKSRWVQVEKRSSNQHQLQ